MSHPASQKLKYTLTVSISEKRETLKSFMEQAGHYGLSALRSFIPSSIHTHCLVRKKNNIHLMRQDSVVTRAFKKVLCSIPLSTAFQVSFKQDV
jgi:hypothetical protein